MADTKISALASGNPAQVSDVFPIARAGVSYGVTIGSVLALDYPIVNPQTGVNYNAVLADDHATVTMAYSSGGCTFTVEPGIFAIGAKLTVVQLGTGQVTIVNGNPSVLTIDTPRSLTTRARYSTVCLTQVSAGVWIASGDLT